MAFEYPKLRLYRINGTCSLVPHMVLHHLGIPFEATVLARGGGGAAADGSFDAAAYQRDVNPAGQVPALAVGDAEAAGGVVILTQNVAIDGYLAELARQAGHAGAAGLLGGGDDAPLARARVQQWLAYATTFLQGQGFGAGWAPAMFLGADAAADEAAAAAVSALGLQRIATAFARFEAELGGGGSGFAVGAGLTLVDFFVYLFWRWGQGPKFKAALPGPYPRLEALARNVENLPGVRKALEAEGLERVFRE